MFNNNSFYFSIVNKKINTKVSTLAVDILSMNEPFMQEQGSYKLRALEN